MNKKSENKNKMGSQLFDLVARTNQQEIWARLGRHWSILCLDSTGFTRTVSNYGILHYLRLIKQLREIALPILDNYGAVKCKGKADNLFACFVDPNIALEAAIALNQAVKNSGMMLNDNEPFRVCIGIGYGKMLDGGDEGMFGDEVNLAYKLGEDVAEGGEILLTKSSHKQVSISADRFEPCEIQVSGNSIHYYKLIN